MPSGFPNLPSINLQSVTVFQGLSDQSLGQLQSLLRPLALPINAALLAAGKTEPFVFFILSGTICIYRTQRDGSRFIVNLVAAGDMLGEVCALDNRGHSASAVSTEACHLLRMRRADFIRCEQEMPRLAQNVRLLLARRVRFATAHTEAMIARDAPRRVARILLALADHYRSTPDQTEIILPLRLTQSELAGLCALTRQCVCGCWKELAKAGVLESRPHHRVKVVNRSALSEAC